MSEVRTRMAPSPTGNLHLGTAYTTLFNYLFAKKNQGTFILRFEDTDTERSKKEFEENIQKGLEWLGFKWDEGPFRQTERLKNYDDVIEKLISENKAYFCFCTQDELEKEKENQKRQGLPQIYSGKCRQLTPEEVAANLAAGKEKVVRFKMPDDRGVIEFEDLLHGKISIDSKLIGDMIIRRSNGMPLYNLAVVVDDIDMKITHVLRADDHISNTPKQIVFFEALGAKTPIFAHWPAVLNPDRIGKLSKRENATSVDDFRKDGYLSAAIVNYMALIGWTMPGDLEIMSLSEMEKSFDLKKMRLSGAAYNQDKFDWINGEYIRRMSDQELLDALMEYLNYMSEGELKNTKYEDAEKLKKIVPLVKDRMKKLSEFVPMTDFLFENPEYDREVFDKLKIHDTRQKLKEIADKLEEMGNSWKADQFEKIFRDLADKMGISASEIFQLIRVAVSGQTVTPPLFESIQIIGEDEALKRVKTAEKFLE